MSQAKYRTEPDGTRVYTTGNRYKPVAEEDRVLGRRKPDHPEAVRFYGRWFLPLDLLPDEARTMPETLPDALTLEHRAWCTCEVCQRPQARILWRRQAAKKGRSTG